MARSVPGPHRLTIRAVDATWIRVQPDEGRATEELLPAGASREWSAERRFLVTIGNAGGVEVALNGKILSPLGPKGRSSSGRTPPGAGLRLVSLFGSFGERVRQGLRRTRELMDEGLGAILAIARPVDEAMLEELEETLIAADLGAASAGAFVKRVRDEIKRGRVVTTQDVRASLHRFLEDSLAGAAAPLVLDEHPTVILMLGVNGAGKTTSTAKMAASLKADGKRVLMAAADTFRAAAIEQLQEWGRRIDVDVIHQVAGADRRGGLRRGEGGRLA